MSAIAAFRTLHVNTTPLRLPNAWDAGSARLFESLGATAIATTSAGVAWALGYRDNRQLPFDELVAAATRMARVLRVPLSVDVENGYADDPLVVARQAMRLVDAGVAGINIEDGADDPSVLAAKIAAIRDAVAKAGADLFVNARCDVFLAGIGEPATRAVTAIARGERYVAAGADGLFLPGIKEAADITAVVAAIGRPLNAMAWPGLADADALGKLGVRRLSAGSGIPQVLWAQAATLARDFLATGSSTPLAAAMPYPELQQLFPAR